MTSSEYDSNNIGDDIKKLRAGEGFFDNIAKIDDFPDILNDVLGIKMENATHIAHYLIALVKWLIPGAKGAESLLASLNLLDGYDDPLLNDEGRRSKYHKDHVPSKQYVKADSLRVTEDRRINDLAQNIISKRSSGELLDFLKAVPINEPFKRPPSQFSYSSSRNHDLRDIKEPKLSTNTQSRYRIIILDDNYYRARRYEDCLYETGMFDCEIVTTVSELFKRIYGREYDAYILDIHVEDRERYFGDETRDGWITGLVAFKKIREIRATAVVVALTYMEWPDIPEWFSSDEHAGYYNKEEYPPREFAPALLSFLDGIDEDYIPSGSSPKSNGDLTKSATKED